MDCKIYIAFFALILGLSTVSGSCYYNSYTTSYYCFYDYYDYYFDYYHYYYSRKLRSTIGIIFGALAGLATLIGLIVCLCVCVCRKTTPSQRAVIYYNPNVGTTVMQANQTAMQPHNQQMLYPANPGQMQTTGHGQAFSSASSCQNSPSQQSTENQN
ncbi:uncharacterized protein LOC133194693 [Saccostrea echinata]|uniref:uncharacterized protein LOC133194693 n=1 Tax=Saccostrea echinata TaxID=191078 RepID=UPI002A8254A0|nr:uncharacterized protein LOC133194693 [Saccostrea echinata]